MKRIGYPVLITAAYIALLILVFSSEFGQKNNFLFPEQETANVVVAKTPSPEAQPQPEANAAVEPASETPVTPKAPEEDGHSPEGAIE